MWLHGVSGRGRPVMWYSGQCVMCGIVAWMSAQFGIVCVVSVHCGVMHCVANNMGSV